MSRKEEGSLSVREVELQAQLADLHEVNQHQKRVGMLHREIHTKEKLKSEAEFKRQLNMLERQFNIW